MVCTFCRLSGHTIRNCEDTWIPFYLLKVRCKKWKSLNESNVWILFNWLGRRSIPDLRAILIHKYNISPKTVAKCKLVSMIMECEFQDDAIPDEVAIWRVHLATDFVPALPYYIEAESSLAIYNISTYIPVENERLYLLTTDELVAKLMLLIENYREAHGGRRRRRHHRKITAVLVPAVDGDDRICECPICYDDVLPVRTVSLGCKHEFCVGCVETLLGTTKYVDVNCPLCRGVIKSISMVVSDDTVSLRSVL